MTVNNRIAQLGSLVGDGVLSWKKVSSVVNKEFDEDLTTNACRKRYRRIVNSRQSSVDHLKSLAVPYRECVPLISNDGDIPERVAVFSDIQAPFHHPDSVEFFYNVWDYFDCDMEVFIGDMVDYHAISAWGKDPDGLDVSREMQLASTTIEQLYTVWPNAKVCLGNHDERPQRLAYKAGLSVAHIRTFNETFGTPNWHWKMSFLQQAMDGTETMYVHGNGKGGNTAALNMAKDNWCNVVMGHIHTNGCINYHNNRKASIYGMNVGCMLKLDSYAFSYARHHTKKPILGMGVTLDYGKTPLFIPYDPTEKLLFRAF